MRELLSSLIGHLDEAGLGSVSEVFDGDPPHTPGGCIAQAWSVAELLRAYNLTRSDVDHMNRESQASTGWRQ
jgi:glycogen debranching enzyme